ncbi:MAG: thioredoxin family protein [Pseudomonadota bacterium]
MRLVFAAIAITFLAACGQAAIPASERAPVSAPAADVRVLAVTSHADWCGSCKALEPKIDAVQAANTFEGVAFAVIDYTSRNDAAFFADAETLGIGAAMRATFADKIKTGRLYLINMDTGEVISTVDKSMDETAITAAITEAAALS